jgi:mRNA interferase HigB
MHIVTRKHLLEAEESFPDAAKELWTWYKIVSSVRWRNFLEVRQFFPDADAVDEYVIFNIRRNRYRLICIIHYSREKFGRLTEGHIYIRSVLTHKAYDDRANWNKGVKP